MDKIYWMFIGMKIKKIDFLIENAIFFMIIFSVLIDLDLQLEGALQTNRI